MANPKILLVDESVNSNATEYALRSLRMRRLHLIVHRVNLNQVMEQMQELAESSDPEFSTDGRLAFKDVRAILYHATVADDSFRLPETVLHRLVAEPNDTVTYMDRMPAA